ncbi:TM198 protein, partial [Sakesphorus luctuosus]|nr:TM198 protein [Sakesphorus luctuosus]
GYRCFKAVMFLSGLLFGSTIIFLLCHQERVLEARPSLGTSAGIALGIGLLCGLLTALLPSVGLFTTGLLLGLLVATALLATLAPLAQPAGSPWVAAGVALGVALLGALAALRWPRALTVLGTGVVGAAALVVCVDYLAEGPELVGFVVARLRRVPGTLCPPGWALLGAWPALSAIAVVVQWKVTAGGGQRG